MELGERLKRLLKLGFFVGAGTVAAVVAACSSNTGTRLDTGPPDGARADAGVADQGAPEAGRPDAGGPDAGVDGGPGRDSLAPDRMPPDRRGWDIPLE
jgi:hypothetical protein